VRHALAGGRVETGDAIPAHRHARTQHDAIGVERAARRQAQPPRHRIERRGGLADPSDALGFEGARAAHDVALGAHGGQRGIGRRPREEMRARLHQRDVGRRHQLPELARAGGAAEATPDDDEARTFAYRLERPGHRWKRGGRQAGQQQRAATAIGRRHRSGAPNS
jgi:hypothetical protein